MSVSIRIAENSDREKVTNLLPMVVNNLFRSFKERMSLSLLKQNTEVYDDTQGNRVIISANLNGIHPNYLIYVSCPATVAEAAAGGEYIIFLMGAPTDKTTIEQAPFITFGIAGDELTRKVVDMHQYTEHFYDVGANMSLGSSIASTSRSGNKHIFAIERIVTPKEDGEHRWAYDVYSHVRQTKGFSFGWAIEYSPNTYSKTGPEIYTQQYSNQDAAVTAHTRHRCMPASFNEGETGVIQNLLAKTTHPDSPAVYNIHYDDASGSHTVLLSSIYPNVFFVYAALYKDKVFYLSTAGAVEETTVYGAYLTMNTGYVFNPEASQFDTWYPEHPGWTTYEESFNSIVALQESVTGERGYTTTGFSSPRDVVFGSEIIFKASTQKATFTKTLTAAQKEGVASWYRNTFSAAYESIGFPSMAIYETPSYTNTLAPNLDKTLIDVEAVLINNQVFVPIGYDMGTRQEDDDFIVAYQAKGTGGHKNVYHGDSEFGTGPSYYISGDVRSYGTTFKFGYCYRVNGELYTEEICEWTGAFTKTITTANFASAEQEYVAGATGVRQLIGYLGFALPVYSYPDDGIIFGTPTGDNHYHPAGYTTYNASQTYTTFTGTSDVTTLNAYEPTDRIIGQVSTKIEGNYILFTYNEYSWAKPDGYSLAALDVEKLVDMSFDPEFWTFTKRVVIVINRSTGVKNTYEIENTESNYIAQEFAEVDLKQGMAIGLHKLS